MSISFRPAVPADDSALRDILRRTPMAGRFSLAFEREPSYFAGHAGETTIVACAPDGGPVGLFSREVRLVFLGGKPMRLGYLGQLRLLPEWRARTRCIPAGFRVVRALLDDGSQDTPFFLTSILDGNRTARRLLTSGRSDLPTYTPLRRLVTLTMAPLRRAPRRRGLTVRPASASDLVEMLDMHGRGFDLHPCWDKVALSGLATILTIERDGRAVACGAVWDRRRVRQIRLAGCPPLLAALRPAVNAALGLAGLPTLPAVGTCLDLAFLSHLAVRPGEEEALPTLIDSLRAAAHGMGLAAVSFGLSEGHPWWPALRGLRAQRTVSTLFAVHWDVQAAVERLARAPLQPEVACL